MSRRDAKPPAGRSRARTLAVGLLTAGLLAIVSLETWLPPAAAALMNRVTRDPVDVPAAVRTLHEALTIADLHADALLWSRDLAARARHGHVDLPRLHAGNVALQVFGAVTQVPVGMNYQRNRSGPDMLPLLVIGQRWPPATWGSPLARALHQARRLQALQAGAPDGLLIVRTRRDLDSLLARRSRGERVVGALLAVEGLHAARGRLENLDTLYAAGYRMMGLAHFFDNAFAGSAHGVQQYGLTPLGREAVRLMERRGIVLDLAHASPAAFSDALAIAAKPVVVSHTGLQGTCPGPRNLTDAQLRAVAAQGGLVGIGFWRAAVCGDDARAIARAIRYAVDIVGAEHVALGSDYDGAVWVPFDAAHLVQLTAALTEAGLTETQIRLVMGENAIRILRANLSGPAPCDPDALPAPGVCSDNSAPRTTVEEVSWGTLAVPD